MTYEEARQALRQARQAMDRPAEKYSPAGRWYRALSGESMLLDNPPAWPLLTPSERRSIIEGRFRTGRYPERGEGDPRPLVAARRAPLWVGLLTGETWAIRAASHIPARLLHLPHAGRSPEAIQTGLIDGTIWAWCREGWILSRFDLDAIRS